MLLAPTQALHRHPQVALEDDRIAQIEAIHDVPGARNPRPMADGFIRAQVQINRRVQYVIAPGGQRKALISGKTTLRQQLVPGGRYRM